MAQEALIEFRYAEIKNTTTGIARHRMQYRTKTVDTGIIALVPALIGVSAWSEWTDIPIAFVTET